MADRIPVKAIYTGSDATSLGELASGDTIAASYINGLAGEVTGTGGATVVADNVIDEANLKVSNSPTNGYTLTAQSGNTGGLTWAAASGGGGASSINGLSDGFADATGSIGLGTQAVGNTQSYKFNIGVGYRAVRNVTSGANNIGIGNEPLNTLTSGSKNIAIGYSLGKLTTASNNVGIGYGTLKEATTGASNVAIGADTLDALTTGTYNVGVGYNVLTSVTTASSNIAMGNSAMEQNTAGVRNIAFGDQAGWKIQGDRNVAIGYQSLRLNTSASDNVAVGAYALTVNTTGTKNIGIGYGAGDAITTGSNNTIIGDYAGTTTLADTVAIYAGTTERLKVTASGLTVNGSAVGGGGAMEFVSKTTISSAVSSVSITGIDNTYARYVMKIQMKSASSNPFRLRYSQNNGSSFDASSNYDSMGDRNGAFFYSAGAAEASLHVDGADFYISTLELEPSLGWINASTGGIRSSNRTANAHSSVIISHRTFASFNALQFFSSSGNLTSGIITLYGIKDS